MDPEGRVFRHMGTGLLTASSTGNHVYNTIRGVGRADTITFDPASPL